MIRRRTESQLDMFAGLEPPEDEYERAGRLRFLEETRVEATALLTAVETARRIPWRHNLQPVMVPKHFHSLCDLLPKEEADGLRVRFDAEMARLWAIENASEDGL